jgi:rubrerythrin
MNEKQKHKLMREEDAASEAMFEIAYEKRQQKELEESDKRLEKLNGVGLLVSDTVVCSKCGLTYADVIKLSCPRCGRN